MIARPGPDEYGPFYAGYVAEAGDNDPVVLLRQQLSAAGRAFESLTESQAGHRYAPGKWSVRQVVGHLSDAERLFTYRAMRMARADATPLPGFDENAYVEHGDFDRRTVASLAGEWRAVRTATVAFFESLSDVAAARRGVANNVEFSVRALGYIIPGHCAHHLQILRERYGIEI